MNKVKINYIVDIILLILFVLVAATGLMKLPLLKKFFFQSAQLSFIHDYSGVLMVVFIFVHLILNLNFMICMTKKYLGKTKAKCD